MLAADYGHSDITEALLQAGAHPNAVIREPTPGAFEESEIDLEDLDLDWEQYDAANTALRFAEARRHRGIIESLLQSGAGFLPAGQTEGELLAQARATGDALVLEAVLGTGAADHLDPSPPTKPLRRVDQRPPTLFEAAADGNLKRVTELLDFVGEDPNEHDEDGWVPLFYAAENGSLEIVQQLIKAGADPSYRSDEGDDALSLARSARRWDVVRYLKPLVDG